MTTSSENRVELHERWLRVTFGERGHADFHLRWLRHNCDRDLHPTTGERMVCSSELPDDLRASHAAILDDSLLLRWEHDKRESRFPLRWLEQHAYARNRQEPPLSNDVSRITLTTTGADFVSLAHRAREVLHAHGAVVVRHSRPSDTPAEAETERLIDAFEKTKLRVIGTHFGRIEDLRTDNVTNQNTDQLGYTDAPIDLHTDQPFLPHPPRFQLLQAIRPADTGGDSYLTDARAAAEYLRSIDHDAFERLTTTTIRFHRKQKSFEKTLDAPILRLDPFQVRWSYFTLAPYQLPFEQMEAWYRAHDRFARIVRDPSHQLRFKLEAGDFVIYDNHRMLHARTAFRGARWLRGVYFDPEGG